MLVGCGPNYTYKAISKVKEAGPKVVAIAIDFGWDLQFNATLNNAFVVNAELKPINNYSGVLLPASAAAKGPRTIIKAYTSAKPEIGKPDQGRYVIIEMAPTDYNAASWYFGYNPGTRQALDYKDNMIYDVKLLRELAYFSPVKQYQYSAKADSVFTMTAREIMTADDFVQDTYTDDTNPNIKTLAYNFYSPKKVKKDDVDKRDRRGKREKVPVVLWLHGSGQSHDAVNLTTLSADILSPLLANQEGVTWIENGREECFVILPQLPSRALDAAGKSGWQNSEIEKLVLGLLDKVIAEHHDAIDTNRIYLGGLSMGGFGSWDILLQPEKSSRFAAAVIDAGTPHMTTTLSTDTPAQKTAKIIADLSSIDYSVVKLPLWMFHCDTDPQVTVLGARVPFTKLTGKATIDANGNLIPAPGVMTLSSNGLIKYYFAPNVVGGKDVRFNEYQFGDGSHYLELGMVTQNGHFGWEAMFKDQSMIDWVFSQEKHN
jgi:predicted peptidase